MLNLLVEIETIWPHSKIKVHCDNMAVQAVGLGKTKDPYSAACLRNLWLLTTSYDIELVIEHIQGTKNIIADLLSTVYSHKTTDFHLLTYVQQNLIGTKLSIGDLKVDFNI